MQTQTSCVFVNMEPWTGCFRLGYRDRREEEAEEENMLGQREGEKIEDKKERECEDMWMGKLLREKKKSFAHLDQFE